jgi:uncharacterized membrane protein
MWIINFLPDWVFHTIFAIGLLGTIAGFLLGFIPFIKKYVLVIQVCSILILVLGVFLEGAMSDNKEWVARVKEMEAKVAAAEAKSQKVNVEIIEKVVKKTEYIKLRGQEIIKYVDRDIVKYDTRFAPGGQCEIPKEFITLHNKAAEAPK